MKIILDAITGNQSISDLGISDGISVDSAMVKRLVSEHPALAVLHFWCHEIMANNVIALIRQLHSLQRFQFLLLPLEYAKLLSHLQDDSELVSIEHDWKSVLEIEFNRGE